MCHGRARRLPTAGLIHVVSTAFAGGGWDLNWKTPHLHTSTPAPHGAYDEPVMTVGTAMDKSDQILAAIEQLAARMATKDDVARLEGDIASIRSDMAIMQVDVATLKTELGAVKTDIATVKTEMSGMRGDMAIMRGDIDQTRREVSSSHFRVIGRIDQLSDQMTRHLVEWHGAHKPAAE